MSETPRGQLHFPPEHSYCWPLPGGVTVEVRFTSQPGPDHFEVCRQYLELAIAAVSVPDEGSECLCHVGWRHCPVHQDDNREQYEAEEVKP